MSSFLTAISPAIILSMIMQTIYPIRPHTFRQPEFNRVEQLLQKWYFDLPEHLRFDGHNTQKHATQPPHILTLHMQYWCTVLLLHRPFIQHITSANTKGWVTITDTSQHFGLLYADCHRLQESLS